MTVKHVELITNCDQIDLENMHSSHIKFCSFIEIHKPHYLLVPFSPPHITQESKSIGKLISQLYGELQPVSSFSRGDGAI